MPKGAPAGTGPAETDPADPAAVAAGLIRAPSVTPADAGAQAFLAALLERLGFRVHRLRYGAIENLYAEIGTNGGGAGFCFAGHTDVVPPGEGWRFGPFDAAVADGMLYGRGAVDMKGGIAAFVAACARLLAGGIPAGGLALLITGDEEGVAADGTAKVLEWLAERGKIPKFCLVGEPTCRAALGDTVKIGRRGSVSARIALPGRQGHVAYPHLADNPVHHLVAALNEMTGTVLDAGTEWFQPSSLQITSVDVGNPATNVIPGEARAALNIRFNDRHTGASLQAWLEGVLAASAPGARMQTHISGEAFLTAPGAETARLSAAIEAATGVAPKLDTGGGTSDARFIARHCPVAEFGPVGTTMHRVDECVPVAELSRLAAAYEAIVSAFAGA